MKSALKRAARAGDILCVVACGLLILLLVVSLAPLDVNHVSADGTTFIMTTNNAGLVLARQSVSPKSAGTLVANVETLGLTDVYDGGQRLPGMQLTWPASAWRPTFLSHTMGWHHGPNVMSGVGAFGPGSIFRVNFTILCLPSVSLFAFALVSLVPLFWPYLRRRFGHKAGLCATCGYDLRATPERCPECGTSPATRPAA